MKDASVLGIKSASKISVASEFVSRCLQYLRSARKLAVPCDKSFATLRTDELLNEEDYYIFDNTPFGHAVNYMTLPEQLVISDFE